MSSQTMSFTEHYVNFLVFVLDTVNNSWLSTVVASLCIINITNSIEYDVSLQYTFIYLVFYLNKQLGLVSDFQFSLYYKNNFFWIPILYLVDYFAFSYYIFFVLIISFVVNVFLVYVSTSFMIGLVEGNRERFQQNLEDPPPPYEE